MKCLVTGATGFIGRQLCQQLLDRGNTVIALSKSGAPLDNGAPTLAIDIEQIDRRSDVLQGVDVVFHLAGIAHTKAADSAYHALNYQATLRLAQMALIARVRCFIFLSSVKSMGAPPSADVRAENECTERLDAYGLSKWQAEQALRKEFTDQPMSVVILRSALVFGANAKGNLQQLASAVRLGLPRPPAGGSRSMIAVEDMVELLCVIAQNPSSGLHTWIACGANSYSTQAIYDMLREAYGKGRGIGWLPLWAWRMAASLLDIRSRPTDGSTFDKLFGTELYSNSALLANVDWRPQTRLEDVVGQMTTNPGVAGS